MLSLMQTAYLFWGGFKYLVESQANDGKVLAITFLIGDDLRTRLARMIRFWRLTDFESLKLESWKPPETQNTPCIAVLKASDAGAGAPWRDARDVVPNRKVAVAQDEIRRSLLRTNNDSIALPARAAAAVAGASVCYVGRRAVICAHGHELCPDGNGDVVVEPPEGDEGPIFGGYGYEVGRADMTWDVSSWIPPFVVVKRSTSNGSVGDGLGVKYEDTGCK
ncbi:hypothetical protein MKZ38_007670 [Zalerion maritima]|uniref:Uncharacterized protein n=1 Tax=Zalerion maritima TaxID=339359 RepID=A0AAD5WY42_9PEZI|nr:hypothetical protein MKZ38_007670 [Zalerion maritima]